MIFISILAASDFSKEEFAQTLSVLGNVRGRAPVVVDEKYIVCPEPGSGMNVNIYANDTKNQIKNQIESIGKLEVSIYYSMPIGTYIVNSITGKCKISIY